MGVAGSETYWPLPLTALLLMKATAWLHVSSSGPKRLNVMVPVGLLPPARVAVSVTCPPAATDGDAVVGIVGVAGPAGVTTTDSLPSSHAVETALLLGSPV